MNYYQYIQCFLSISLMVITAIIDIRTKKIPNKIVFPYAIGIFSLFLYGVFVGFESNWYYKIALLVGVFILGFFDFMGMGDIKLLMVLTLCFNPYPYLCGILLACFLFVLFSFLRHPKKTWKHIRQSIFAYFVLKAKPAISNDSVSLPFAPFIATGFIMVWVYLLFIRR